MEWSVEEGDGEKVVLKVPTVKALDALVAFLCDTWTKEMMDSPLLMPIVYVGHPVSGDVEGNLKLTKHWIRWLCDRYPNVAWIAPWITEVEVFDDANPPQREAGLRRDEAVSALCTAFIALVKFTTGVQREADANERVIDATALGELVQCVRFFSGDKQRCGRGWHPVGACVFDEAV